MNNFHNTLNEALEANNEKLIAKWPLGVNISYGETQQVYFEEASGKTRLISVYRNDKGMYETAISYITD